MIKYYYGTEGDCLFDCNDIEQYLDNNNELQKGQIIIEMKPGKNGERLCILPGHFWQPECGKERCCINNYEPRNGKNGICKHLQYGLVETGRRWIVLKNEPEYLRDLKKISGRKK